MAVNSKKLFSGVYAGKKVLVTGDTGFKGSWLCLWLNQLGAKVYGYGSHSTGAKNNYDVSGINKIVNHRDGDINDFNSLKKYFNEVKPDIAFHLAAQALVLESYTATRNTIETNVIGTANFLEAVKTTKSVKAAVNVTSDKCYRNTGKPAAYSEDDFLGGIDPYSASKSCSEIITYSYEKCFFSKPGTCNIACGRAGNVMGGGDWARNRIVPDFIRSITNKKELVLRDPHSVRPWQFVLEPLSGYLDLAVHLYLEGKKFGGGWNFGPDARNSHSVLDLIKEMEKYLGDIKYKVEPSPFIEASLLRLNITKAGKHMGWKPVLNFKDTIRFTIEGYKADIAGKNIYAQRLAQLEEYIEKAAAKKIKWATYT